MVWRQEIAFRMVLDSTEGEDVQYFSVAEALAVR
jgi:hypothetical protein